MEGPCVVGEPTKGETGPSALVRENLRLRSSDVDKTLSSDVVTTVCITWGLPARGAREREKAQWPRQSATTPATLQA